VVFICYGQNEALTAGMTPENFARQLGQFLDELAASGIPCVLISPHELFPALPPIPSPSRFNGRIRVYSEAAGSLAQSRQLAYVDLFTDFSSQLLSVRSLFRAALPESAAADGAVFAEFSDNGMHLSDFGYACTSLVLRQRLLGIPAEQPIVKIDAAARTVTASGAELEQVEWSSDGATVSLRVRQSPLTPVPLAVQVTGARPDVPAGADTRPDAAVPGAPLRLHSLSADGKSCLADSTAQWEQLRELIRTKNELYFHRWRPQNITYLFGFRKHEQGNNAADIARFDPFIEELEGRIHTAQQPQWQPLVVQLKK
jgi:hypothetical protein